MWIKDYSHIEHRLLLLIAQLFVLLAMIGLFNFIYVTYVLPDKQVEILFHPTECFLITKKLTSKGHFARRYQAGFLVSYQAKGAQYNRWVTGNGLDKSFTFNPALQTSILAQYLIGNRYTCLYNPKNPEDVILVPRRNWFTAYPLLLPAAIGSIMIYYLLKNIFFLAGIYERKNSK